MITVTGVPKGETMPRTIEFNGYHPSQIPEMGEVFRIVAKDDCLRLIRRQSEESIPFTRSSMQSYRCEWGAPWAQWIWNNIYELLDAVRPKSASQDSQDGGTGD